MNNPPTAVPDAVVPSSTAQPAPGRLGRLLGVMGPSLVALVLGVTAWLLDLHGTDFAAQTYRSDVVRLHGIVLWDSGWYGGSFPLSYSVLGPALGAVIGLGAMAIIAAVVATACFDRIVVDLIGRRTLGTWYFAASTVLAVTIGQVPYLAGEAIALAAVIALLRRRTSLAVVLGLAAVLFSPLAAAFLVMVCMVWAVTDAERRRGLVIVAFISSAVVLALGIAFPGTGAFPFTWSGLVIVELLCVTVLSPLVRTNTTVRLSAGLYGLASLAAFVVPNPIGGNAARLAESVGVPVVACLVTAPAGWRPPAPSHLWRQRSRLWQRRVHLGVPRMLARHLRLPAFVRRQFAATARRPALVRRQFAITARRPALGFVALVPFIIWQWAPGTAVMASTSPQVTPSTTAVFYQPLVRQLLRRSDGVPRRVEVVPTTDHWEAAYVAPYISLARGWERQLDVEDNPIFYVKGQLEATSYRAWLLANGVSWVALPTAPLDYAGVAEAALVRRGHVPGLTLVWSTPNWRLWRVDGSPGLLTGPARLTSLEPDRLDLDASKAGVALVRVRYSAYWRLAAGDACVAQTPTGWTEVRIRKPGRIDLGTALIKEPSASCAAQTKR